jgi:hypothetical protein
VGELVLGDPSDFHASAINGFAGNDIIDLATMLYSSNTPTTLSAANLSATVGAETLQIVSITNTSTVIQVTEAGETVLLTLNGDFTGRSFTFSSDGSGGTTVVDPPATASGGAIELQGPSADGIDTLASDSLNISDTAAGAASSVTPDTIITPAPQTPAHPASVGFSSLLEPAHSRDGSSVSAFANDLGSLPASTKDEAVSSSQGEALAASGRNLPRYQFKSDRPVSDLELAAASTSLNASPISAAVIIFALLSDELKSFIPLENLLEGNGWHHVVGAVDLDGSDDALTQSLQAGHFWTSNGGSTFTSADEFIAAKAGSIENGHSATHALAAIVARPLPNDGVALQIDGVDTQTILVAYDLGTEPGAINNAVLTSTSGHAGGDLFQTIHSDGAKKPSSSAPIRRHRIMRRCPSICLIRTRRMAQLWERVTSIRHPQLFKHPILLHTVCWSLMARAV